MHFLNPKDYDLLQNLLNEHVITMTEFQSWKQPEEGNLMDVAMDNHQSTSEHAWITNLIKQCGIHRFNNPKIDPVVFSQLKLDIESIKTLFSLYVYPVAIVEQALWVGILRRDTDLNVIKQMFEGFDDIFFCALCPREAAELITVYKKYAKQELKTVELEKPKYAQ